MEVSVTFEKGKMNSDVAMEILPKGEHISSNNMDFFTGSAIPMKGMSALTDNGLVKAKTLGTLPIPAEDKIYYAYTATNDEGIIEYTTTTDSVRYVLRSITGKLNLKKIKKFNLVDDLLFFTDGVNPPRRVDRSIVYTTDGFDEKDISVIKPAPLNSPRIEMGNDLSGSNNLEDKFILFSTRYKYITGEFSAPSPFSKLAFLPKGFDYNYSTNTNNGMVNTYNFVEVFYNTGDELVEEVQILFKETGSNALYVIDTFNKAELGFGNSEEQSYIFKNNKRHKVLPTDQLARLFDNVPLKAGAQEIIGNRLIYGDYTDGYDIDAVDAKHSVEVIPETTATVTDPKESIKTNRDYEIARVYKDAEGRMATPIVSKTNTIFVPHANSDKANRFMVTIPSTDKAPAFAKSYSFFIKQSRIDYELIIPSLFYEDGVFIWVKYEEADKEKITIGDYLIVKRDTSGSLITNNVEVRILEAGYKSSNFLRPEFTGIEETDAELRKITNEAGYYFKFKPENFIMDVSDLETLEDTSYHNTRKRYDENIYDAGKYISDPIAYGDSLGGVSSSGAYLPPATSDILGWDAKNNQQDVRFTITINTNGTSFSWICNAEVTSPPSGSNITIQQIGGTFLLAYGVSVTFPNRSVGVYPYIAGEYLTISAKTVLNDDDNFDRAMICLKGFQGNEIIEGGARIQFWIKEYGGDSKSTLYDTVYPKNSSQQYQNLEEWWYGDNISLTNVSGNHVFFRRGYKTSLDSSYRFYENNSKDLEGDYVYPIHILIRGQVKGESSLDTAKRGKMSASIKIVQNQDENSFPIFETKPKEEVDNDLFFEIGDTYLIDNNGNHLGDISLNASDINQSVGVDAKINIRYFNCYSFGNGVESYKIRDGFNDNRVMLDARALKPIEDYKQIRNESDFTWSGAFSKSTGINKLNEFNLATENFKELSTKQDGPIRTLSTRKGDIIVFQDALVSKVLFGRTLLTSIDGTQVVGSEDILGAQTFYSNKFGIGNNPESLAEYGNNFYFADPRNGTFIRGGYSGLDEIVDGVKYRMKDLLRCNTGYLDATYDLRKDAYIVNINGSLHYFKESALGWTTTVDRNVDAMTSMNDRTFGFLNGDIYEFYEGDFIGGSIKTIINDFPNDTKTFEALKLSSKEPVDIKVSSNDGYSTVASYEKREDFYYGYIPKSKVSSSNRYGIGVVNSVLGNAITMVSPFNSAITLGDTLETEDGIAGTILSVVGNVITISSKLVPVTSGLFVLGGKDDTVEGDTIRGKYATLDITFDTEKDHELLTITADIDKSFN